MAGGRQAEALQRGGLLQVGAGPVAEVEGVAGQFAHLVGPVGGDLLELLGRHLVEDGLHLQALLGGELGAAAGNVHLVRHASVHRQQVASGAQCDECDGADAVAALDPLQRGGEDQRDGGGGHQQQPAPHRPAGPGLGQGGHWRIEVTGHASRLPGPDARDRGHLARRWGSSSNRTWPVDWCVRPPGRASRASWSPAAG